jgi:tRNA modification GTPase
MPGPKSFTGEDVVELQCHGGPFLVRRVIGAAMAQGARMATPGEFSRRAFLNGRMDLTEAEAIADLVSAQSDASLRQALEQLTGALADRVKHLREQVIGIRAQLEVEIDFSDEGLKLPSREEIARRFEHLRSDIRLLHDSFAMGRLMREGVRVAIVGKPNVGKSSLLNLLLGVERAIVTAIPGTTRDIIEDTVQIGPWAVVLQDTAGLRDSADQVERIGIERAIERATDADMLLAIFDRSRVLDHEDQRVIDLCRNRPAIALLNKTDLPHRISAAELRDRGLQRPILPFSAISAEGLDPLRREMLSEIQRITETGESAPLDGVAISRERHRDTLAKALEALVRAREAAVKSMPPEIIAVDVGIAADSLGAITGDVSSEDVLDSIFRDFCIGK